MVDNYRAGLMYMKQTEQCSQARTGYILRTGGPSYLLVGSPSTDSTTMDQNFWERKIPKISKKQNLNFPCTGNYLHSIYIVLGIITNLVIYMGGCAQIICKYYTILHKGFEHLGSWYQQGSWNQSPADTKGRPVFDNCRLLLLILLAISRTNIIGTSILSIFMCPILTVLK